MTVRIVAETGSTNADLLADVVAGFAVEGDWLVADRQTAGRGRLGRQWGSPLGNFYGSTVVGLQPGDPSIGGLSLAAGYALFLAIGHPARLKWPNDLMIDDAKVAGVLLERQGDKVVVGYGINLLHAPDIPGRKTTSLSTRAELACSRDAILDRLMRTVPLTVDWWRQHGTAAMTARWQGDAHALGTQVSVTLANEGRVEGRFEGLTDAGALRLGLPSGGVRVIHSGDVALV